jgi:hypothetical protein
VSKHVKLKTKKANFPVTNLNLSKKCNKCNTKKNEQQGNHKKFHQFSRHEALSSGGGEQWVQGMLEFSLFQLLPSLACNCQCKTRIFEKKALLQPNCRKSSCQKEDTCVVPTSRLELPRLESE